jgi:cytochrome b
LNDVLQNLLERLRNLVVAVTCIHVGLVVILRVWRGPQAPRPMWRGYARTSG